MHSNYWGDPHAIGWLVRLFRTAPTGEPSARKESHTELLEGLDVERRLHPPDFGRRPVTGFVLPIGVLGVVGIIWSQFVWLPRAEQANLAEWERRVSDEGVTVAANAMAGDAIDTASSEMESRFDVVAFYYKVGSTVYGTESGAGRLPYATPRFPHVDWAKLKADLLASGRDRLPVEVVHSISQPRIFVVPQYSRRPSYYGAGRIFFYVLRTAVMSICWLAWCLALQLLLKDLAPREETRVL